MPLSLLFHERKHCFGGLDDYLHVFQSEVQDKGAVLPYLNWPLQAFLSQFNDSSRPNGGHHGTLATMSPSLYAPKCAVKKYFKSAEINFITLWQEAPF